MSSETSPPTNEMPCSMIIPRGEGRLVVHFSRFKTKPKDDGEKTILKKSDVKKLLNHFGDQGSQVCLLDKALELLSYNVELYWGVKQGLID
ncbi:MAG: hypothetical protein OHK93_002728 [Ramalina farinacea]|uniref:Uncharacterized protein n=1 Tax=Ramalina farinacea TaxID=258253 RepID=A0AA43TXI1_9LECA|nr:hypothetical protein [Ramalina farinacea]